ncbi:MAG: hypothetical protein GY821_00985 [Gammaproteobacteria bacterium]|nr:hypothetical protein [Gammaproteobacteria bacterium]
MYKNKDNTFTITNKINNNSPLFSLNKNNKPEELNADNIWKMTFDRHYSPKIPEYYIDDGKKKTEKITLKPLKDINEFNPRNNKSIINLPPFKKMDSKYKDQLKHSDAFEYFLNGQTIELPSDMGKSEGEINDFLDLLEENSWQEIIKTEYYEYYAIELFRQKK